MSSLMFLWSGLTHFIYLIFFCHMAEPCSSYVSNNEILLCLEQKFWVKLRPQKFQKAKNVIISDRDGILLSVFCLSCRWHLLVKQKQKQQQQQQKPMLLLEDSPKATCHRGQIRWKNVCEVEQ